MAFAQHHLGEHKVIKGVQDDINDNYLREFSFNGDTLEARIRIAPDLALTHILERFELAGWATTTHCSWRPSWCCCAMAKTWRCSW
jgi:hypothetical protein